MVSIYKMGPLDPLLEIDFVLCLVFVVIIIFTMLRCEGYIKRNRMVIVWPCFVAFILTSGEIFSAYWAFFSDSNVLVGKVENVKTYREGMYRKVDILSSYGHSEKITVPVNFTFCYRDNLFYKEDPFSVGNEVKIEFSNNCIKSVSFKMNN